MYEDLELGRNLRNFSKEVLELGRLKDFRQTEWTLIQEKLKKDSVCMKRAEQIWV